MGNSGRDALESRIDVVRWRGRYLFLVDGRGDGVFDRTWGITTFDTEEDARRAGEVYLLASAYLKHTKEQA
jgi:hypothetical protein